MIYKLFLEKVFYSDTKSFRDFVDEYVIGEVPSTDVLDNNQIVDVYDITVTKLPELYAGLQYWPKTCKIRCWNCTMYFSSIPLFIPFKSKNIVHGVFCSIPCGTRYCNDKFKDNSFRELFYELVCEIYGSHIKLLQSGPHYTDLIDFGGQLSETELKREIYNIHKNILGDI